MPATRRLRRGIYLLPTLFTVGNLFCGFSSVLQASRGNFGEAAGLVFLAGLLDLLDGRIARLTGSTSEFGVEFDSLADLVSFGVAPAFLAWQWALAPLHRLGWLITFLFVVSAAMRLARFNLSAGTGSKRYFAGLPAPAAAGAVACVTLVAPEPSSGGWMPGLVAALVVVVAILMVSRVRYRSFKDFDLRDRRSYVWVFPLAAVLGVLVYTPTGALATLAGFYVLSGPLGWCGSVLRRTFGVAAPRGDDLSGAAEVADEPIPR